MALDPKTAEELRVSLREKSDDELRRMLSSGAVAQAWKRSEVEAERAERENRLRERARDTENRRQWIAIGVNFVAALAAIIMAVVAMAD